MFHVMFIYNGELANVDMLWIWCINFWKIWYSLTSWLENFVDAWQHYDRQVDVLNDGD